MHTMLLGSVLSVLMAAGGLAMFLSRRLQQRRFEQLSPGRVVIATNLVGTRRRNW